MSAREMEPVRSTQFAHENVQYPLPRSMSKIETDALMTVPADAQPYEDALTASIKNIEIGIFVMAVMFFVGLLWLSRIRTSRLKAENSRLAAELKSLKSEAQVGGGVENYADGIWLGGDQVAKLVYGYSSIEYWKRMISVMGNVLSESGFRFAKLEEIQDEFLPHEIVERATRAGYRARLYSLYPRADTDDIARWENEAMKDGSAEWYFDSLLGSMRANGFSLIRNPIDPVEVAETGAKTHDSAPILSLSSLSGYFDEMPDIPHAMPSDKATAPSAATHDSELSHSLRSLATDIDDMPSSPGIESPPK